MTGTPGIDELEREEQQRRANGTAAGHHGVASRLVALAAEWDLYHTPGADPAAYCDVRGEQGQRETYALHSTAMRRCLTGAYYRQHGGAPRTEAVREALAVLEARAIHEGAERVVGLRIAEQDGVIYL